MKTRRGSAVAGIAVLATGALFSVSAPAARAQQNDGTAASSRVRTTAVAALLTRISRDSGILVVADSSIKDPIPSDALPNAPINAETVEEYVAAIVKALPAGTTWARLNLPAPPNGRAWTGDAVADYALAQAKLFGKVGSSQPGVVEVLGQKLPADQAKDIVANLNLKPVYVITNPTAKASAGPADLAKWNAMSPEEKQQYAQQQAQQLINMDPQVRAQMLQQQMSVMGAMIQNMSPEQRQQMFQSMGGMMGGMRGGFGPGGGPPGGGRRRGGN